MFLIFEDCFQKNLPLILMIILILIIIFISILFITDDNVDISALAITLLKINADLSVSFATMVSKIFSFIKPALFKLMLLKIRYFYQKGLQQHLPQDHLLY